MDVAEFAEQLFAELANLTEVVRITSAMDGPTLRGQAYVSPELFLHFFYNEQTGTTALALIRNNRRIWGVDYDKRSNWHVHPLQNPTEHRAILTPSIVDIVTMFREVLDELPTQ